MTIRSKYIRTRQRPKDLKSKDTEFSARLEKEHEEEWKAQRHYHRHGR